MKYDFAHYGTAQGAQAVRVRRELRKDFVLDYEDACLDAPEDIPHGETRFAIIGLNKLVFAFNVPRMRDHFSLAVY